MPPLSPWRRRSKSSAFHPSRFRNGAFFTISRRERFRPWTRTTVPFAPGAGTHQPESGMPSRALNVTSSKGKPSDAGVRPCVLRVFHLEGADREDAGEEIGEEAEDEAEQAQEQPEQETGQPFPQTGRLRAHAHGAMIAGRSEGSVEADTTAARMRPLWGHWISLGTPSPRLASTLPPICSTRPTVAAARCSTGTCESLSRVSRVASAECSSPRHQY